MTANGPGTSPPRLSSALRICLANLTAELEKLSLENEQLRLTQMPTPSSLSDALRSARALSFDVTDVPVIAQPSEDESKRLLQAHAEDCSANVHLPGSVGSGPLIASAPNGKGGEAASFKPPEVSVRQSWVSCTELHPSAHDMQTSLAGSKLNLISQIAHKCESESIRMSALGVLESLAKMNEEGSKGNCLERFVHSFGFKVLQTALIAANTIWMGVAADYQVKRSWDRLNGKSTNELSPLPDIAFAIWFTFELALRIGADNKDLFVVDDYQWNLFDAFLVASSVSELLLVNGSLNVSFLRIFRVFRVVRVIRVVRTVKALAALRTMIFAILNSFICLSWALIMITIIVYVFSLIFDGAVSLYFEQVDSKDSDQMDQAMQVYECFGTLYETMVSLFCAVTGGNDWMGYGQLLRYVGGGETYFLVFVFYIGFCLVGLLNVVTGIFVDSAVCTRTDDEIVQNWKDDLARTTEECKAIFMEADKDHDGEVSYEEIKAQLENPRVSAYFAGLQIDPDESGILFTLLDANGSGTVDVEEFIAGTMRLKGTAKSIDIMALMFDQAKFNNKFNKLCSFCEDQLREIKDVLMPDAKPTPRMFLPLQDTLINQMEWTRPDPINLKALAAQKQDQKETK